MTVRIGRRMSTSGATVAPRWRQSEPRFAPSATPTPTCQPMPTATRTEVAETSGRAPVSRGGHGGPKSSLEADLSVRARRLHRLLGFLQPAQREPEELADHAHRGFFGPLLGQRLFRRREQLDRVL